MSDTQIVRDEELAVNISKNLGRSPSEMILREIIFGGESTDLKNVKELMIKYMPETEAEFDKFDHNMAYSLDGQIIETKHFEI